jgi:UDP:flavonoid glycosyltransferase YjiC (YdhE family)
VARIVVVAPPFAGHLQPALALARRLARDHDLAFFSSAAAAPRIEAAGIRAVASRTASDAEIDAIVTGASAAKNNPFALARQVRGNVALMRRFTAEFAAFLDAEAPELVIADFAAPVAGFVARERGIAWWTSHASPAAIETPDGPPAYLGGLRPARGAYGRARDALGRAAVRTTKRALFAAFAAPLRSFGMPAMYRADGTEHIYSPECVLALGYPELEFATRFPRSVRFVGPAAFAPERPGYEAPPLGAGPNVLVTIGTQAPWFTERMWRAVRAAARACPGVTFHFTTGGAPITGLATTATTANAVCVPYVRYETDVARYDLVVHHAGTGILNAVLHAGVPSLAYPLDYDQFDCAARLEEAGLARRVRRLGRLDVAVREALASAALRDACRAFARDVVPRYDAPETVAALVAAFMERRARERCVAPGPRARADAASAASRDRDPSGREAPS